MRCNKIRYASIAMLSLLMLGRVIAAETPPASCQIDGVPRIKQLTNYCGPATVAAVLQCFGEKTTQEMVGKIVYNAAGGSTNGADMLYYARSIGYSAYSWNSSIEDVKKKIAAGAPVIVLQQNSTTDASGHYRVLTGYDDRTSKFRVMDPYYDNITEMTYAQCERLWRPMGRWSLLIVPPSKDTFAAELNDKNPVVHMDMSYALYTRGDYVGAQKEAKLALALEPNNSWSRNMLGKINRAMGAGKSRD